MIRDVHPESGFFPMPDAGSRGRKHWIPDPRPGVYIYKYMYEALNKSTDYCTVLWLLVFVSCGLIVRELAGDSPPPPPTEMIYYVYATFSPK